MTATGIETIESLDFDFDIICEALQYSATGETRPECDGNPADWKIVRAGCCEKAGGSVAFYCNQCLNYRLMQPYLVCPFCDYLWEPPIEAYITWMKIR